MMLGVEGDFLMTNHKNSDWSWNTFNNDIYLQFTYSLPRWKFTVGNRVMFYDYKFKFTAGRPAPEAGTCPACRSCPPR